MTQPGDPERGERRRRPIPWPRHVEIAAIFAALSALLVVFYVLFGRPSETLRRFAVELGYEDSYVKHCMIALPYYLKTYEDRQLLQSEYLPDPDPHDVRLAYDTQGPSGATIHGEFRCLFKRGSAYSSDFGPRLNHVEVDGIRLPLSQTVRINLFAPSDMQHNRE